MKPVKCSTGEIAKTYKEYLKTRHWFEVKKKFRESNLSTGKCLFCRSKKTQIHHKTYLHIGNELIEDLAEVCARHHSKIHKKEIKIIKKKRKKTKKKKRPVIFLSRDIEKKMQDSFIASNGVTIC